MCVLWLQLASSLAPAGAVAAAVDSPPPAPNPPSQLPAVNKVAIYTVRCRKGSS